MNSLNVRMRNVVLIGFRATGKSTVGRLLAARLGWRFLDADDLLQQQLGAPIAEVVAREGWPFFRRAEARLLVKLADMEQTVLATGGGAIEHQQEWRALQRCGLVVWLDADTATIRRRLAADPNSAGQRPSLTGQAIGDEIDVLLARRRPLYAAGSQLHLNTETMTPEQLVEAIAQVLTA